MESAPRSSRFTSTSLSFGIIGVINPWPLFRLCSVLERDKSPRLTAAFEVLWTWLKFPVIDKHNLLWFAETTEMFVRSEIKTPQDLKGKKMGINRFGATAELMSRIMLKNMGLDPYKDMTFVQVGGGPERTLALMNNLVQASLFSPPEPVKLAKEPTLRLLAKLSDQGVVYPYLNMVTTRKYLKERPDIIRSFVKGYLEALKFYATNKTEASDIIAKRLRLTDKELVDYVHKTTAENSYMKPYVPRDA